jgi:hypothetical protein
VHRSGTDLRADGSLLSAQHKHTGKSGIDAALDSREGIGGDFGLIARLKKSEFAPIARRLAGSETRSG